MQPHPLAGEQVGEDGLAEQGVPEAVAAVVGDHEQVVVDGLGQRLLQLPGGEATDRGHRLVPHPTARDGGDAQHLLGGGDRLLDPGQQHVAQPERQRLPRRPAATSSSA